MGETAENLADKYSITREEADAFALSSQQRAAEAKENGRLAKEIIPIEIKGRKGKTTLIEHDEHIRPGVSMEDLAKLPTVFRKNGVVTAANSSGINDAAAMVVLTTWGIAKDRGLKPLGKLVSWGAAGVEPTIMGIGPVPATLQALQRADLNLADIEVIEANEAFATQYLAVEKELKLDRDKTNLNGGGISIGHPLGATGARITLSALYELREKGAKFALSTMCIGGGQGISSIIEYVGE